MTLDQTVDILLDRIDPELVTAHQRQTLLALSCRLPPIERGGFELRFIPVEPLVDLQQCIHTDEIPLVKAHLMTAPKSTDDAAAWSRLYALLDWAGANPDVTEIWMEFDTISVRQGILPVPSLFVGLDEACSNRRAHVEDFCKDIVPSAGRSALKCCLDACDGPIFVSHVGVMLSRSQGALRLNVKRLNAATLPEYLKHIGMADSTLPAPLLKVLDICSRFALTLDLAPELVNRTGFECVMEASRGWVGFLMALERQGWLGDNLPSDLLDWPGISTPANEDRYPDDHLVAGLWRPQEFSRIVRRISHVKLTHDPELGISAKGYLWFHHEWQHPDA